jgi:uncharacterized protein involved in exopolysaccharide biosynthesis
MTATTNPSTVGSPRWAHVATVLFDQWRLILQVTAVGVAAAVFVLMLRAPTYQATAHLAVIPERARMIVSPDPKTGTLDEVVSEQDLNSEVELLKSDQLLREVLRADSEAAPPAGVGAAIRRFIALPNRIYQSLHGVPSDPLEAELRDVREDLDIMPVKGSNLIRVSYRSTKPERAAALVNDLTRHHVDRPASNAADARSFFEKQRELLHQSRSEAERGLREFYEKEGVVLPAEPTESVRARLLKLHASAAKARTDLEEAEARQTFLSAELKNHPRTIPGKPAAGAQSDPLQLIRSRVVELELKRSKLLGQFSPTSSKIADVDRQLAQARTIERREVAAAQGVLSQARESLELAAAKAEADTAALRARVESLQKQIDRDQPYLARLEAIAPERERLEQEVAAAREALKTYRRKQEEARFSSALDTSRIVNVSIVEPASVPVAPLPSKNAATVALAAVLSLFVGVGFAFLRDRMNPSVKSAADAADVGGVPILADLSS